MFIGRKAHDQIMHCSIDNINLEKNVCYLSLKGPTSPKEVTLFTKLSLAELIFFIAKSNLSNGISML